MPPRPGHARVAAGLRGDSHARHRPRLLFYIVTAIAAVTVDFFIPRLMPGNPVEAVLAHLMGQRHPGHHPRPRAAVRPEQPDRACGAST